jgi:ketosteroid isomerase-like protein
MGFGVSITAPFLLPAYRRKLMKKASMVVILAVIFLFGLHLMNRSEVSLAAANSFPPAAAKANDSSMEQQVVAKEREGLEALKSGNLKAFADLTADDAIFVDSAGPATKEQVLKNVADFRLTEFSMENVQFLQLSPTTGFLTYKVNEQGTSHGNEFSGHAYVSSIWIQRGNKWVCQFSQETGTR